MVGLRNWRERSGSRPAREKPYSFLLGRLRGFNHGGEKPMNLLQRLKIETAFAHDRAEEAFDLQTRTRSLRAYRDLLARLYGFHAVWEPRAEAALADAVFSRGRRKVGFLRADLRELGMAD